MTAESAFARTIHTTLRDAVKLKKVMRKRGLKRARAKCPECEGMLWGSIMPNGHLHMACDGPCKRGLMQ